jgi:hypothetical protein
MYPSNFDVKIRFFYLILIHRVYFSFLIWKPYEGLLSDNFKGKKVEIRLEIFSNSAFSCSFEIIITFLIIYKQV